MVALGDLLNPEEPEEVFTEPVFCLNCKTTTVPDSRWRCKQCRDCCRFGIVRLKCKYCSEPTWARRSGYKILQPACLCRNPERIAAMRTREANDLAEAKREAERSERARLNLILEEDAAACLSAKSGQCRVHWDSMPHDMCRRCKKWGSRVNEVSFGGDL